MTNIDWESTAPRVVLHALINCAAQQADELTADATVDPRHRDLVGWLNGFNHALAILACAPELMAVLVRAQAVAAPDLDLAEKGRQVLEALEDMLPLAAAWEQQQPEPEAED